MAQKIFLACLGVVIGGILACSLFIFHQTKILSNVSSTLINKTPKKQVIGFLPYWLLQKASKNYSDYITTLSYFSLTIDSDGTILKYTNPQEKEPGWYALESGKADELLQNARTNNQKLSVVVFASNEETIGNLLSHPIEHANNLVEEITPIMTRYGFSDLNLDIESIKEASDAARFHFTKFVQIVKKGVAKNHTTLTVDISATDFIKRTLINPSEVGNIANAVVVMTYDYHFTNSFVTGPVAPLFGAGIVSEYDVQTAIEKAQNILPSQKIILGVPLYGYEWETIGSMPRSAVIPQTGIIASNQRIEEFLQTCTTCHLQTDTDAKEPYLIYQDTATNTYHHIFYPDQNATLAKVQFANNHELGGIALWALGYEGRTILNPLKTYKE